MDAEKVFEQLAKNAATAGKVPGVSSLTCTGFVPDAITPPAFFPAELDIAFDQTFGRGMDAFTVTCRVLTGRADDKSSQRTLLKWLSGGGSYALKAAIESDKKLGGYAFDLRVLRVQGMRFYEHGEKTFVGAEIPVYIIGPGE